MTRSLVTVIIIAEHLCSTSHVNTGVLGFVTSYHRASHPSSSTKRVTTAVQYTDPSISDFDDYDRYQEPPSGSEFDNYGGYYGSSSVSQFDDHNYDVNADSSVSEYDDINVDHLDNVNGNPLNNVNDDPFVILDLESLINENKKAIKRAYKDMAVKYHPSMCTNEYSSDEEKKLAHDRFTRINWAYESLMGKDGSSRTGSLAYYDDGDDDANTSSDDTLRSQILASLSPAKESSCETSKDLPLLESTREIMLHTEPSPESGFEESDDPFVVLNLQQSIALNQKAVKKAYLSLARRYHPDNIVNEHSTPEEKKYAHDRFAKINWAYETLTGKNADSYQTTPTATYNDISARMDVMSEVLVDAQYADPFTSDSHSYDPSTTWCVFDDSEEAARQQAELNAARKRQMIMDEAYVRQRAEEEERARRFNAQEAARIAAEQNLGWWSSAPNT